MTSTLLWSLIAIQIAMGAFDTLYHHEMTERLAWRPSQRGELRLHAVRNGLYALLFLTLGFIEPRGLLAILVMAVLLIEVIITLMDFVEEDLSRRLPPSERINHTLLALNYGAILVMLLPLLIVGSGEPTGFSVVTHGAWSTLAASAAIAVAVFGLRDWFAADRSERLGLGDGADLAAALERRSHVLVTGATGFIGKRLVGSLAAAGHEVTVLTRDSAKAASLPAPVRIVTDLRQLPVDTRLDAIVNLAGEPIANGPWTAAKRRRALASRLRVTGAVRRLVGRLETRPTVVVSGSAVGWYGLHGDEELTETGNAEPAFTHRLCEAWERSAVSICTLGPRVVLLRTGLVLGVEGGFLARMLAPFEFGLGGRIGTGRQWMSWIERDDLVRLICHAIATPSLSGPLNATAPQPVRNAAFTEALAQALRRPALIPVSAGLLRHLGGDFAEELLLGGQRVVPAKAMASGFAFRHTHLETALGAIVGGKNVSRTRAMPQIGHESRPILPPG